MRLLSPRNCGASSARATSIQFTFYVASRVAYLGLDGLTETGREAPALVDFIISKDCPVSASLTVDDKAKLLKIKQNAEKKFPAYRH